MIVNKIDTDKDGFVTEGELKDWIKKAQKKYVYDNVEHQWQEYDMNQDGLISWDEYRNVTYGTYLGKGSSCQSHRIPDLLPIKQKPEGALPQMSEVRCGLGWGPASPLLREFYAVPPFGGELSQSIDYSS